MTKKSLLWQILSFLVVMIAGYNGLFNEKIQMILGIISFAITIVLQSPILSSGQWPKGWDTAMWVTQLIGISIQMVNYLGDHSIVPAMFVNLFIFTANTVMVTFVKQYNTTEQ